MKTPLCLRQCPLTPVLVWPSESVPLELHDYGGNEQPTLGNEVNSLLPRGSVSAASKSVDIAAFLL
jgi:hypothetical protein